MYEVLISKDGKKYEKIVSIRDLSNALAFANDLMKTHNCNFSKVRPHTKP